MTVEAAVPAAYASLLQAARLRLQRPNEGL